MRKYIILIGIILISSCSSTQRMERSMFDPPRKGAELRMQKKFEKSRKQKKSWVSQPKRR